jgi:small basic protein (TIGR04137 family)
LGWSEEQENRTMSMHSSFKSSSKIAVKRNVLKRYERINLMLKRGTWKKGDRALGIPKTKQDA